MGAFAYEAPTSVDAAVAILDEHAKAGTRAQVLAGGTDLLVQMRSVDTDPRTFVDIKHIEDTNKLDIGETETFIGSAIPSAVLNENKALRAMFPGLLEAADLIGSTQIQGRASLGGNLCNSSPAADTIPAIIVNYGVCLIAGPGGRREVPAEEFCTGVQRNALEPNEFLVGIRFKNQSSDTGDAYLRFIPRTEMDIAVAGCGVRVTVNGNGECTDARVAIGAVAPTPLLVPAAADALMGTRLDDAALAAAGEACTAAASPITDKRGTVEYRKKVVAVLCRRAGQIARERAHA